MFESPDGKIFQDDRDLDLHYFNERFENVSVLHVTVRGLKTNFENFRNLLSNASSSFNIICLTETWRSNSETIYSSYFGALPH